MRNNMGLYEEYLLDKLKYKLRIAELENNSDIYVSTETLNSLLKEYKVLGEALHLSCEILAERCKTLTGRDSDDWKEYLRKEGEKRL